MRRSLRRAGSVAGIGVVVGASFLGLAGPVAASAAPVGPISMPSSAFSTGGTATARAAAAWGTSEAGLVATAEQAVAAGVSNPGWQVATRLGTGATKLVGVVSAPFTTGLTGFFLGFEGANSVMRMMGVKDVGIGALFPPALVATYVPDSDLVILPAGWMNGDAVADGWARGGGAGFDYRTTKIPLAFQITGPTNKINGLMVIKAYPGRPFVSTGSTPESGYVESGWSICQYTDAQGPGVCSVPNSAGGSYYNLGGTSQQIASTNTGPNNYLVRIPDMSGGYLQWVPVGNPLRPPDQDPHPLRRWETRFTCTGSSTLLTSQSPSFKEGGGTLPDYPTATCGGGLSIASMQVWEITVDGSQPAVKVDEWTAEPGQAAWQAKFPQCAQGACTLELYRTDPTAPGASARVSCFDSPSACVDWWQDPAKSDNYACVYGGVAVAIGECSAYAPTFNVKTGDEVQTATGPRAAVDTAPYADPSTGEPVDGTSSAVPPADSAPEGCPPAFSMSLGGFGYWVTKGVGCALAAAFVPSADVLSAQVIATRDVVSSKPPFSLFTVVSPIFAGLSSGWASGCSSQVADFGPDGLTSLVIPCRPPQVDAWTALYAALSIAIGVVTALNVWHMLVAALGGRTAAGEEA